MMRLGWLFVSAAWLSVVANTAWGQSNIVDTAVGAGKFKTLAAALQAAGLAETLANDGPFTVFAPTDEAFAKLPSGTVENLLKPENREQLVAILTYHVVSGRVPAEQVVSLSGAATLNGQRVEIAADKGVMVDKANVVQTDIECSNGIIHVIDSVLLPETGSIPEVATKAGTFGTLLKAAQAAGLVGALSGDGPLTVFAPTDEAFGKLPSGTINALLAPSGREQLAEILKLHVVSGRVYGEQAFAAKSAATLAGESVAFRLRNGRLQVNGSNIVATDIDATNGVIHVIDQVILPKAMAARAQAGASAAQCRAMIEDAVHRGSRVYNSGHHAQCATIYRETMQTILDQCSAMPQGVAERMRASMAMANHQHATQSAWTLRHGMEDFYVRWAAHR